MLRVDSKFPARLTFIVKFRSDATLDMLCGRIENLVSCKQSDFSSARELCELIARDFGSSADEPANDS